MKAVIYIHGKGGNAGEAGHYKPLFPDSEVIGFDYISGTPWEAKKEFPGFFDPIAGKYDPVILISNSIGAYFSMHALSGKNIERAYFISPVADMEKLIRDMMSAAGVSEDELKEKRVIRTDTGEDLSWEYLSYVREHPAEWDIPTVVIYGSGDALTSFETIKEFSEKHNAALEVMEGGEHWFHTEEQMRFIDGVIKEREKAMEKNGIIIRREKPEEYRKVEELIRESFWNVYRPGCYEHYVIHTLRDDPDFVSGLDFVMEKDGVIIGQNMFVKTVIETDDGRNVGVLTMGPICITPGLKRKGYGKILLDFSLEKAAEAGFGAVLFEGNIDFYGKSGFTVASGFGIRYNDMPEDEDTSFFLCKELIPGYLDGVKGAYRTPAGYLVSKADVESFDKSFPPKEKQKLPGQLFDE